MVKASDVTPDCVLTDGGCMWMVDDTKTDESGKVSLKIRAGRTDKAEWTKPIDPDRELDIYVPQRNR